MRAKPLRHKEGRDFKKKRKPDRPQRHADAVQRLREKHAYKFPVNSFICGIKMNKALKGRNMLAMGAAHRKKAKYSLSSSPERA